jgi:hypothetical protein
MSKTVCRELIRMLHGVLSLRSIQYFGLVLFMVFNATFNNIPVISWQSVLLVQETGVPGEKISQLLSKRNYHTFCTMALLLIK